MSRLDSAIRRLSAQRDCLAAGMVLAPAGQVLEIGLGNGRTYDHLREIAPGRDVWVIDREMNAHPSCTPPAEFFLRGEAGDMLAALHKNHGRCIAFVHYDLGVGVAEQDVPLRAALSTAIRSLMVPGGILVANGAFADFDAIPLPAGVQPDRYFMGRLPQS